LTQQEDKKFVENIKNNKDLLGTGQNANVLIKNYIPKERRVRG